MGTEEVTAAVIEPWQRVGLTKEQWDDLEIPGFLRRCDNDPVRATTAGHMASKKSPTEPVAAAAPAVDTTGGLPSGIDFAQFRVDPDEIERKIRAEADIRWRNWVPTKTDRKRPRLSTYVRAVRKEFY